MSITTILLLAAAALGWLAVPLIAHAAAPGETTMPAPTIDTNGDGKPDAWDRDGDGRADVWDRDSDGKPNAIDEDGDGKPDPAQPTKQSSDKPEPQGRN